jgi:hypothetical protein
MRFLPLRSIFFILFCAISASAQTVTFSGHITDQNTGLPISGVAVVAEGNQTGTRVAVSDGQGSYSLPFGANTNIQLRAYKTNYIFNPVLITFTSFGGFPISGSFTRDFTGTALPFLIFARPPVLLTEDSSLNALTLDGIVRTRDPFSVTNDTYFGADKRTRLTLLLVDLDLFANQGETLATITAQAQDAQLHTYVLTVEDLRKVPGVPWMSQLTVRLPPELANVPEAQVTVSARAQASKPARVRFKNP